MIDRMKKLTFMIFYKITQLFKLFECCGISFQTEFGQRLIVRSYYNKIMLPATQTQHIF